MTWSLIDEKKKSEIKENEDFEILDVEDTESNEKNLQE